MRRLDAAEMRIVEAGGSLYGLFIGKVGIFTNDGEFGFKTVDTPGCKLYGLFFENFRCYFEVVNSKVIFRFKLGEIEFNLKK